MVSEHIKASVAMDYIADKEVERIIEQFERFESAPDSELTNHERMIRRKAHKLVKESK